MHGTERANVHSVRVPPIEQWPLRGGAPCLDFANTVGWRPAAQPVDGLISYADLIAWAEHAEVLSAVEAHLLGQSAAGDRTAAASLLVRATAFRETIHRLFHALAHGKEAPKVDLQTLNAWLQEGALHASVVPFDGGFVAVTNDADLALPLWRLAESAGQLLISGQWRRVRECPGHDCGWLFLDSTKNGNRRWCDSGDCGNRARVRAHYQRRRAPRPADQTLRSPAV